METEFHTYDIVFAPSKRGDKMLQVQIQGFIPGGDIAVVLPAPAGYPALARTPYRVPVSELMSVDDHLLKAKDGLAN